MDFVKGLVCTKHSTPRSGSLPSPAFSMVLHNPQEALAASASHCQWRHSRIILTSDQTNILETKISVCRRRICCKYNKPNCIRQEWYLANDNWDLKNKSLNKSGVNYSIIITTIHSQPLCSAYFVAGAVPSLLGKVTHLIFAIALWGRCYYSPHFTGKETGTELRWSNTGKKSGGRQTRAGSVLNIPGSTCLSAPQSLLLG